MKSANETELLRATPTSLSSCSLLVTYTFYFELTIETLIHFDALKIFECCDLELLLFFFGLHTTFLKLHVDYVGSCTRGPVTVEIYSQIGPTVPYLEHWLLPDNDPDESGYAV